MTKRKRLAVTIGILLVLAVVVGLVWRRLGDLRELEARLDSWPASTVVRARDGVILGLFPSSDGEFCVPVNLAQMGPYLPAFALVVEDKRFRSHGGIDWRSLAGAVLNALRGRRRGASTITAQVIRMALPSARTISTKLREFAQAERLERRLSKNEILELYLNRASFGANLRGVEAASLLWFGRNADRLSPAQAAMLVAMVKAPTAYRPDLHPKVALARRNLVLSLARAAGVITEFQYQGALQEALPMTIMPLPSRELLFCQFVADHETGHDMTTTLDRGLQARVCRALSVALLGQPQEVTAAAVLIENDTGAVRAMVANARWGTPGSARWVDCANALRSPGSALKPFIYAMAFEQGLITPASLMADTPLSMGGRNPRNFDKLFRGPVSAERALQDSLNVPAVRLLRALPGEELLARFRLAGLENLSQRAEWYGDSLALGGCDVSPLQLAEACTAFARWGERITPVFLEGQRGITARIFTPQAAWLVTDVLADPGRLPATLRALDQLRGKFAFKTGTSYGLRDAWTTVWNATWTLVVWLGDPTGHPHQSLVGLSAATPAAVDIWRELPDSRVCPRPEGVERREVCALSGLPPSDVCPMRKTAWYIPAVSPAGVCQVHRFSGGRMVTVWPPDLARAMGRQTAAGQLTITSPLPGADYLYYERGGELALRCEGTDRCHWYVDGHYVGTARSESLLWPMEPGRHTATVMDDQGRQRSIEFSVSSIFDDGLTAPELTPREKRKRP